MDTDTVAAEHERRQSNRDAIAVYFKAHPGEWIDAADLETIGGRYAWRTRVSEARTKLGMWIENKQDRSDLVVRSYYRYLVNPPIGQPSDVYRPQTLFTVNDREANR